MAKKAKRKTAKKIVAKRAKGPVKKVKRPAQKKASAKKTSPRKSINRASPAKKKSPARAQRKPTRKIKTRVPSPPAELLISRAEPLFVTPLPMDDV